MASKTKSKTKSKGGIDVGKVAMLSIAVLAIVGVVVWLGMYFGVFTGPPAAPPDAHMTPEVNEEWQKANAEQEKARQKINKPPSGS